MIPEDECGYQLMYIGGLILPLPGARRLHRLMNDAGGKDEIKIYTKILEVNLFAFAYRLFRRDFSPLDGTYCIKTGHIG